MDNHGALRSGEHEYDLGVWDNYHLSMRTNEEEVGELMGGRQFPRWNTMWAVTLLSHLWDDKV